MKSAKEVDALLVVLKKHNVRRFKDGALEIEIQPEPSARVGVPVNAAAAREQTLLAHSSMRPRASMRPVGKQAGSDGSGHDS